MSDPGAQSRSAVSARSPTSAEGMTLTRSTPPASRTAMQFRTPHRCSGEFCSAKAQGGRHPAVYRDDLVTGAQLRPGRRRPGRNSPISGRMPVSPITSTPQNAAIANRKLNNGPATTTAERTLTMTDG